MLYIVVVLSEAINVYRYSVLLTYEYIYRAYLIIELIYCQNKYSHISKIIQFHDIFKHILIESSFHNLVFFLHLFHSVQDEYLSTSLVKIVQPEIK